jgi:hypothetical protein
MSALDDITKNLPPTSTKLRNFLAPAGPNIVTPLEVLDMEVTDDTLGGQPFLLAFSAPDEYNFNTAQDPMRKQVLAFVYAYWVLQTVEQATVAFLQSNVPPDMLTAGVDWMTLLVDDVATGRPRLYSQPFTGPNRAAAAASGFALDPCPVVGFNTLCEIQRDCNQNQQPEKIQNGTQKLRGGWRNTLAGIGAGAAFIFLLKWGLFALIVVYLAKNILCSLNLCACPCDAGIVDGSIENIADCGAVECCDSKGQNCKAGKSGVSGKRYLVRGCRCETSLVDTCCGTIKPVTKPAPTPGETAGAIGGILLAVAVAAVAIGAAVALSRRRPEERPPPALPPSPPPR